MSNRFIAIAPMEGVVDPLMREVLTGIGGIRRAVTEFIRVTDRLLPESVFYSYCPELKSGGVTSSGVPVFVQLLGGRPAPVAENARLAAEIGAPGIDLNFGCPAKTVNRHDGGAALLQHPHRVFDVTSAVRGAVPAAIPVTVKVRLGFEHKDFARDIALAAAQAGAASLTIHARTKMEMYRPPAHWEYIQWMAEAIRAEGFTIPVIANGEIWTVDDYHRCRLVSGCSDVALGRGLIANPFLAWQIQNSVDEVKPWKEAARLLEFSLRSYLAESEKLACARFKQWCKALSRTWVEARDLFERTKTMQSVAAILEEYAEGHNVHMDGLRILRTGQEPSEQQRHSV